MTLSRTALLAKGALMGYLAPKLAMDVKPKSIDLTSILAGVTAQNFGARKPSIETKVRGVIAGKLARDENLSGLSGLLDSVEEHAGKSARDEESEERQQTLNRLCAEYIASGHPETLESICNLLKVDSDEVLAAQPAGGSPEDREAFLRKINEWRSEDGAGALDRAKHAMDQANEKCRRLTGRAMTMEERQAWRQRNLSRDERRVLAMDEMDRLAQDSPSYGGKTIEELFPDAARFGGRSPSKNDIMAEMDAMLARIGAA